jgi:hypothetical protein
MQKERTMKRSAAIAAVLVCGFGWGAAAQTTGMPYYHAPYRAFSQHELGGTISFLDGATGFEGLYGFGTGRIDVGVRGGFVEPEGLADAEFMAGVRGRGMFLLHTEDFPLDGSFVAGLGTWGFDHWFIPGGVSFGRRIDIENSPVSIVPYGQPTLIIDYFPDRGDLGGDDIELLFTLGLGADVRVSRVLDLRVGIGLGDIEGVSLSAVWVR